MPTINTGKCKVWNGYQQDVTDVSKMKKQKNQYQLWVSKPNNFYMIKHEYEELMGISIHHYDKETYSSK